MHWWNVNIPSIPTKRKYISVIIFHLQLGSLCFFPPSHMGTVSTSLGILTLYPCIASQQWASEPFNWKRDGREKEVEQSCARSLQSSPVPCIQDWQWFRTDSVVSLSIARSHYNAKKQCDSFYYFISVQTKIVKVLFMDEIYSFYCL